MFQAFSRRHAVWQALSALFFSMAVVGCGSAGEGAKEEPVQTLKNGIALGPVAGAAVTVTTLDGRTLAQTQSAAFDPETDLLQDGRTLVAYAQRQVGKFSVSLPTDLSPEQLLLVRTDGGTDIDPDDDGEVVSGEIRTVGGSLYAFATVSALTEGEVTVNAFTTLAALFALREGLGTQSEIEAVTAYIAARLFRPDAADTPLNRFNPAQLDAEGNIADMALLSDAQRYTEAVGSDTLAAIYAGTTPPLTDTDGDGLFDDLERLLGSDPSAPDTDGDGLNDYGELFTGTDPDVSDAEAHADTLYPYQWHLENSGQSAGSESGGTAGVDIGVRSVWSSNAGRRNIYVGVVDTGVEAGHPDLASNLDRTRSIRYSDRSNDPSPDAAQLSEDAALAAHGTACAGLIAATGWNGLGVRGVAPFVKLAGLNVFSAPTESSFIDAMSQEVDISSNSWGLGSELLSSNPALLSVMKARAEKGRGGKGTVFVLAAGNERSDTFYEQYHIGNANNTDLLNNRYAIAVAAVNADGRYASYSNFGANVLVTAPGGEYGVMMPAMVTTDLTGVAYGFDSTYFAEAYRGGVRFDVPGNAQGDYTNYMNGTSSSASVVSGVVALMLSANPALTYRDVRYILATTARLTDPADGNWTRNGAGYLVNPNYGFGLVDAAAAVAAAKTFTTLSPEATTLRLTASPHAPVPDADETGIASSIQVSSALTVEHVDVWVSLPDHTFPGDLDITLVSPEGTESRLAYGGGYYVDGSYDNWRFSTAHCLDENAAGTWTLRVRDLAPEDTGTLESWSLQISGR